MRANLKVFSLMRTRSANMYSDCAKLQHVIFDANKWARAYKYLHTSMHVYYFGVRKSMHMSSMHMSSLEYTRGFLDAQEYGHVATWVCMNMHACFQTRTYVYMHTWTHTNMHMCSWERTSTHMCSSMRTSMQMCSWERTITHMCFRIGTSTHICFGCARVRTCILECERLRV